MMSSYIYTRCVLDIDMIMTHILVYNLYSCYTIQ